MKASENFKNVIQDHLNQYAKDDELFAKKLSNPNKNIDDCVTYIMNTVQKSGINGFEDGEIYAMAIHYYDEENIEVGKPIAGKVVVNHTVMLSPEEIAEAKRSALTEIATEAVKKLGKVKEKLSKHKKTKAVIKQPVVPEGQSTLFS